MHCAQHFAVLFQHRPVARLDGGAKQETPGLARNAFELACAPEEDAAGTLIDWRDKADNDHRWSRAAGFGIGNHDARMQNGWLGDDLHPIQVDTLLLDASHDESLRRLLDIDPVL